MDARFIRLAEFEKKLGYAFQNKSLLDTALTHRSYVAEHGFCFQCYERMEFLGDAVLQLVVSHYLYDTFAALPEGKLSAMRAALVREETLFQCAQQLNLWDYLRLGRGERENGIVPSVSADAMEAILAAVYLDSQDLKQVAKVFWPLWQPYLQALSQGDILVDYKTCLQEYVQKRGQQTIRYQAKAVMGPPHQPQFEEEVWIDGQKMGTGRGKSRKSAQQEAARQALAALKRNE